MTPHDWIILIIAILGVLHGPLAVKLAGKVSNRKAAK